MFTIVLKLYIPIAAVKLEFNVDWQDKKKELSENGSEQIKVGWLLIALCTLLFKRVI